VLTIGVVASVLVAAATWWRRQAGLLLILAVLPWAVHHPATHRTLVLAGVVAALQLAYLTRSVVDRRRGHEPRDGSSAVMRATGIWAAAGLLSLFNLPWTSMLAIAEEYRMAVPGRTWWDIFLDSWRVPDNLAYFSVVAAIYTVQAGLLAWIVWREVCRSSFVGVQIAVAQVMGLCVALGFGLAEAAGADVASLRGTDLVHFGVGSIQSLAGNRGWFSQYITYAMPYCVILLVLLPVAVARMTVTIAGAAALVSLVLAFQRGGWVVGLLVLAGVAVATITGPLERASQARQIVRRAAATLLVLAFLAGLTGLAVRTLVPQMDDPGGPHVLEDRLSLAGYISRIQGVDFFGGREKYWPVAWELWKMHPLIGSGIEGFAYQYAAEVEAPTGRLHGQLDPVSLATSSHNIYLQTAVGTGALGLLALLGMFGLGLRAMVRTVTGEAVSADRRMVALAAGGSLLAIMVYGMVQEVTYIHALRLMLCCAIGLLAGGDSAAERRG